MSCLQDLPPSLGPPHLCLLDCETLHFSHLTRWISLINKHLHNLPITTSTRRQYSSLSCHLASLPKDPLTHLTLDSMLMPSLPPTLLVEGVGGTASLATLHLSWAQWCTLLTHNITCHHLTSTWLEGRGTTLRLPYQLVGESLASLTTLAITGLTTSTQQAANLFLHLQQEATLRWGLARSRL